MSGIETKARIMVVDDSPFIHRAIGKALLPVGYDICGICSNGKQAVEEFENLNPDLFILDITMPVMDGLQAAKHIVSKKPQAKIIFLSAMGDDDLVEEAKSVGAKKLMTKPFTNDELVAAVKEVLEA